jgi:hypothetical protein
MYGVRTVPFGQRWGVGCHHGGAGTTGVGDLTN